MYRYIDTKCHPGFKVNSFITYTKCVFLIECIQLKDSAEQFFNSNKWIV